MPTPAGEKRAQLMRDGFCIFENVLEPEMVAKLNAMSEWTIAQEDAEHFEKHRSQGCIIPYWKYPHPTYPELIAHPRALAALAQLGFDQPKVWSGFVISKPPHSPAAVLASGWRVVGASDQLHRSAAAVFPDVLPGRYQSEQRLSAPDPRLAQEASCAARHRPSCA